MLLTTVCVLSPALKLQLSAVLVVVGVDAELDALSVDDVGQTEDVIVSQWREVSADEKHDMHGQVDEILRPFGLKTRLLVVDKANSLALFFLCMTLSALMRLRDHGSTGQLRDVVQSLFTFCLLYTSPSPRDGLLSRMPSSA